MAEPRLEQTKQTGVISAFADMARGNKPLMAAISLDQAKYLLAQIVGAARPGEPIDAGPLYEYLREAGAPVEAVHELFLGLERRVGNLGLQLRLPAETAALPASERSRLAEKGSGRATDARKAPTIRDSGVRTHPAAPPGPTAPAAPAAPAARAASAPAPAAPVATMHSVAAEAAAQASAPASPAAQRQRPNRLLLAGAGLAALIALVYFLAPLFRKDPAVDAAALLGPPGDPSRYVCASVEVAGGAVICKVDLDLAKGLDPDHKARLEATRALAASGGFRGLRLFELATGRPLPEPR